MSVREERGPTATDLRRRVLAYLETVSRGEVHTRRLLTAAEAEAWRLGFGSWVFERYELGHSANDLLPRPSTDLPVPE